MGRPPLNLEMTNQVDPAIERRIQGATLRRRPRDPELAHTGAGKGYGYGLGPSRGERKGSSKFIDVGAAVVQWLDPQSARALAQISRAAYVGWNKRGR